MTRLEMPERIDGFAKRNSNPDRQPAPGHRRWAGVVRDLLALTALTAIGYGTLLIYEPAAWIAVGAIVLGGCVWGAKRKK